MKIQLIILLLITNFSFGQNRKFTVDANVLKYEVQDEFERFDDIDNSENGFNHLNIYFKTNSLLKIENSHGEGFTGEDISFIISNSLKIKDVSYNFWTDNIDLENVVTYKVSKATLTLNQNPFDNLKGLRGKYILEIEHYRNGSLTKTEIFKGKFKTFKGINKQSADYKWVIDKSNSLYGNHDGIYKNPDKAPSLKSGHKRLIEEIKKIKGYKPKQIKAFVVINEKGKIEKEPIRFAGQLNEKLEKQITELLIELTEWYPACLNDKEVKSQIPIIIGTE